VSEILEKLDRLITENRGDIEQWFQQQRANYGSLVHGSVDLRHSGFKVAPVDTNLFPAGFNLLSDKAFSRATEKFQEYIKHNHSSVKNILIIPENHTRNLRYLDNLTALKRMIENSGYSVYFGWTSQTEPNPMRLITESGENLIYHDLENRSGSLHIPRPNVSPDLILLNNDLSKGLPAILSGISQTIIPAPNLGWFARRKSDHFAIYNKITEEFSSKFGLDPWLISTEFTSINDVDFSAKIAQQTIAESVDAVISRVKRKYAEYNITSEPYVFVKADRGTYGMGILTARSGAGVLVLNKDTRKKMNVIKEGIDNSDVIIQEGVPTIDVINGFAAEPLLYLVNGEAIGGVYRTNTEKDSFSNLNSRGMGFEKLCDEVKKLGSAKVEPENQNCNFCVFKLISELAMCAAALEAIPSLSSVSV
jgi:glutamate--cysteine ligase